LIEVHQVPGQRYFTPNQFEITVNGTPLAGGQLFTYVTGTATPLATYADVNLTTPNTNPIVADSNGRFGSVFLGTSQAYKIALYTAIPAGASQTNSTPASPLGSEIWSEDPCGPAAGGAVANFVGIIGEVRFFAGLANQVPQGWYLCYGQAVSRTTYSVAFGVIGTTFGAGDGSTTFNLPDLRGRSMFGLDNMGGTAANNVTAGVSGVPGTTLGGTGGSQYAQEDTITTSVTITDPGHQHTSTSSGTANHDSTAFLQGATTWDLARNVSTNFATTNITATAASTSGLTGASQNMPPAMMMNAIIYLGA
jgi:microcystin-dependent protein